MNNLINKNCTESSSINKIFFLTMLYDFYSELITNKQKEIFELYHLNDFSLNEIANELNISRQAVLDSIKRTEKSLMEYEEKLHLVLKYTKQKENISKLIIKLENINTSQSLNNELINELKNDLSSLLD